MSNYNLNQSILFYIQILLSSSFIFTILISISLSYNEILKLQNKKTLFSKVTEENLLIFNRSLSVLIAFGFLWLNIQDKKYVFENYKDMKHANLQIDASFLNLISTLIVLYVALDSINNLSSSDFNNPVL